MNTVHFKDELIQLGLILNQNIKIVKNCCTFSLGTTLSVLCMEPGHA